MWRLAPADYPKRKELTKAVSIPRAAMLLIIKCAVSGAIPAAVELQVAITTSSENAAIVSTSDVSTPRTPLIVLVLIPMEIDLGTTDPKRTDKRVATTVITVNNAVSNYSPPTARPSTYP